MPALLLLCQQGNRLIVRRGIPSGAPDGACRLLGVSLAMDGLELLIEHPEFPETDEIPVPEVPVQLELVP